MSKDLEEPQCVAFAGTQLIARGSIREVVLRAKARAEAACEERVVVYEGDTGRVLDVDLSGPDEAVLGRLPLGSDRARGIKRPKKRKPGRPKLGVTAREVSLLPRHWAWLDQQGSSASAVLRRLVEDARKRNTEGDDVRARVGAAYGFMFDLVGDAPGFDEAARALFAHDFTAFHQRIAAWPADVQEQLSRWIPNG